MDDFYHIILYLNTIPTDYVKKIIYKTLMILDIREYISCYNRGFLSNTQKILFSKFILILFPFSNISQSLDIQLAKPQLLFLYKHSSIYLWYIILVMF